MMKTYAPIVSHEIPNGGGKKAGYQDCTQWGGGLIRYRPSLPGAVSLNPKGDMLDLRTSEVYHDSRFDESVQRPRSA